MMVSKEKVIKILSEADLPIGEPPDHQGAR